MTARPLHEGAELLFAGDIFCDVVFAGVDAPEQGAEVYAEAFTITVYSMAPASSRVLTTRATLDCFWPMAM